MPAGPPRRAGKGFPGRRAAFRLIMYHFHKIAVACLLFPMSLVAQSTPVGGSVTNNTTWSPAMGTILVYSNVIVSAGATLTIQAGTAVRMTNGLSISPLAG